MRAVYFAFFIIYTCAGILRMPLYAQNIIGYQIMVGVDAPAFIAFPSEVDNVRWDNREMNNFYKISTRNQNTIQISYNGKEGAPANGTGFSVIQGKNTHVFNIFLKKDYDINKDPVLYYDFSDKGRLKTAAERPKKEAIPAREPEQEIIIARREKEAREQKEKRQKKAEEERRVAEYEVKNRDKEIAKQEEKERERQLIIEKEQATKKEKTEVIVAQKEEKQELSPKEEVPASPKQKKKNNKHKERVTKVEKTTDEDKRQEQAKQEELPVVASKDEEVKETDKQEKKESVRVEKPRVEKDAYTMQALYNRYGKGPDGINFYDIPPEQYNLNNTDFYVSHDTLTNYNNSMHFLKEAPRLILRSEKKQGVSATLLGISFENAFAYYRIKIINEGKEDYLVGANSLAWYQHDGKSKYLKCSYLTFIGFFPIVPPGTEKEYVYVTRAANINETDKLVFSVSERRSNRPKFEILFNGSTYLREQERIQRPSMPADETGGKKKK